MWPDTPNAPARGSFLSKVPMPIVNPDTAPTKAVSVSCQWLPYIRGALMQLLLQATWDERSGDLNTTQARVWQLLTMFNECDALDLPFSCSGDFREEASPFGLWTLDTQPYSGVWIGTAGYQITCGVGGDGNSYCGIRLKCQLDAPASIADVELLYDYSPGSFAGPLDVVGVYDITNSAHVGTWLTNSTITPGSGLSYHSGSFASPSSEFLVFIHTCSKTGISGSCDVDGLSYLLGVGVHGTSRADPCLVPGE